GTVVALRRRRARGARGGVGVGAGARVGGARRRRGLAGDPHARPDSEKGEDARGGGDLAGAAGGMATASPTGRSCSCLGHVHLLRAAPGSSSRSVKTVPETGLRDAWATP